MDAPPSNPSPSSPNPRPHVTVKGTLLGFPAMIPPLGTREESGSLPHDFNRWSTPPPNGLAPIVPCDEPDDEDVWQWSPRALAQQTPPAAPEVVYAMPVVDDPVILPTRSRDAGDRRFALWMSVAILIAIAAAVLLRFLV